MKHDRHTEAKDTAPLEANTPAWARMSDVQRTKWFLHSTRLHDTEQFRSDFGSFNGPYMAITNPSTADTKKK